MLPVSVPARCQLFRAACVHSSYRTHANQGIGLLVKGVLRTCRTLPLLPCLMFPDCAFCFCACMTLMDKFAAQ